MQSSPIDRPHLSKRENEVFNLLVQGMSNRQISIHLCVSEKTVEKHITSIYQKIGVHSRAEAIIWEINHRNDGRDFPQTGKDRDIPHSKWPGISLKWRKISFLKRRPPMKKKDWLVSIIAGTLLGIMAIGMGIPRMLSFSSSAKASSQINEILTLVLNSHTKWMTAQGEVEITWYGKDGQTQAYINDFVIYQPLSAYVNVINKDGSGFNEGLWISDGENTYNLDKKAKSYTQGVIPNFANDLSTLPSDLPQVEEDVVYNHPFSLLIPAPVKEYIYPEWFAQGNPITTYSLLGEDSLLGRRTWIVELQYKTGQATAWIDQTTGMILKFSQIENGEKFVDVNFTSLEVDMTVDAKTFGVPSDYQPAAQN